MPNRIITGDEAKNKIAQGVNAICDVVSSSLGPKGKQVGIDYGYEVKSIRDGVTIANSVFQEDPAENFAVRIIQQAARKQVAQVGDGTTVTCLLAQAIYKECMKNIAAGVNPMSLVKGLVKGKDVLLEALKIESTPLDSIEQAIQIATISAQDESLGKQIGEVIFNLGIDGVVTTDESPTGKTYVERHEGMQFDQGYISPAFITDPARMEATVENTHVLLTDKEAKNVSELAPLLNELSKGGIKNLVIIAPDVTESLLGSLIMAKIRGAMNVLAIKAPYTGQTQKDFLDDIAVLTGGRVVSRQAGQRFESVTIADLGQAVRITSTETSTLIVGSTEYKADVDARVESIKALIALDEGSDYQKAKLKERFAKLTSGIAVVKVGAPTEVEMKNWIERAKDAIEATTAALKEGFVPGGEIVYLTIRDRLQLLDALAYQILYTALEVPYNKLMINSGLKPDAYISRITNQIGMDVIGEDLKNMIEAGIIDPTMVISQSIINAVSVASILMTTESLILPIEEKQNAK